MSLRRFENYLMVLAIMIIGLMALGAGVRTMNAGLSCPDWPLCFGKVIPDFHVGVYFEFIHRAYAGLVAILFTGALIIAFRSKEVPSTAKVAAGWGIFFLSLQIVMGGLTVLKLVKAVIVTGHLLLATLFLGCVLWMLYAVRAPALTLKPRFSLAAIVLPVLVFIQIAIGGLVASTYSGSVCVDWPLCNGQWVPTWKGAIGLQVVHRFYAYSLVVLFVGLAAYANRRRHELPPTLVRLFYAGGVLVMLQTFVGIMNLIYFIPPLLTVLHQTLAMLLLAVSLRISFGLRSRSSETLRVLESKPENLAAVTARPS